MKTKSRLELVEERSEYDYSLSQLNSSFFWKSRFEYDYCFFFCFHRI